MEFKEILINLCIAILVMTVIISITANIQQHKDKVVLVEKIGFYQLEKFELQNKVTKLKSIIRQQDVVNKDLIDRLGENVEILGHLNAEYMGEFKVSHYCSENYEHICGNGDGLTASGSLLRSDISIAVDRNVIPLGTIVYIEGYGIRKADDVGGAVKGMHIDVCVDKHGEALDLGVVDRKVWILKEVGGNNE